MSPNFPDFDRLTPVSSFGRAARSTGYVYRPTHVDQIAGLFRRAAAHGFTIAPRGAGRSYGDAALNGGQVVLDLQRMDRVLDWDPASGVIRVEPGVTIEQVWRHTLEDGWWPPVVPGTMRPTLGGCLGMNVHGKNNFRTGPIGEHVLAFEALLPTGEHVTCTPTHNADLFYGLISGAGLLGVFTSITLQLKHLYSGNLAVEAWATPNLAATLDDMEPLKVEADYLVGWIDGTATGRVRGRGQIHQARYLPPGADPRPAYTLSLDYQALPDTLFGLLPKSILWRFMRLGLNRPGVALVNAAKHLAARLQSPGRRHAYEQSLAAFNFLLDYIPNWQHGYGRHGLLQYQSFIPRAAAAGTFLAILELSQRRRQPSYLGVLKRHRPDLFLLSHAVDGFSLALDFPVPASPAGRADFQQMAHDFDQIVLSAGGRFYLAKDSTLTPHTAARYLGPDVLGRWQALKMRCDPGQLLQTELYRRVLAPALASASGAPPAEAPPASALVPRSADPAAAPQPSNGHRPRAPGGP
ncbi:MAG: FAD-binding oxidoreductase [Anaerolineales bacterium]|nr:FAD-binding oxidoreductase [Anaerolineales bacterium]